MQQVFLLGYLKNEMREPMSNLEILKKVALGLIDKTVKLNHMSAFIPGGFNGPYFDLESPARNTAHASIIFLVLFKVTKNENYRIRAEHYLNYLIDNKNINRDGIFVMRYKIGKDTNNGVIGQAWIIEAFNTASIVLDRVKYGDLARNFASKFRFSKKVNAWYGQDAELGKQKIDYTLNHQLWYASIISEIRDTDIQRNVLSFLDYLEIRSFQVRENGLIQHVFQGETLKNILLKKKYEHYLRKNKSKVIEKEIGYHLYNLFALARIHHHFPKHPFFKTTKFLKSLDYAWSDRFIESLKGNKYAYSYNSPAFEFPLIAKQFKEISNVPEGFEKKLGKMLGFQIRHTFDENANLFQYNTPDPLTLTSRTYELALGMI